MFVYVASDYFIEFIRQIDGFPAGGGASVQKISASAYDVANRNAAYRLKSIYAVIEINVALESLYEKTIIERRFFVTPPSVGKIFFAVCSVVESDGRPLGVGSNKRVRYLYRARRNKV